ncbi:Tim44 domain-containing protein [Mesorhizobium sp. RP14(2022)]|uniref:Tim44 domain-containing protein n=2 Tax=Mesorhizobium liriopis TaxID=2953882 RepID=A0ABT1C2U2_9HYPH|nr:Tim44 domain-containing protein [Mesorhizobium liriopis]MCO6049144.1 Tim44 domain-containing protein [Mesorhizobium liriopis]
MVFSMIAVDHAEARRGGSFGSRGTRTFQSAPATRTAPQQTAPINRSMTPNQGPTTRQNQALPGAQPRPGFGGGLFSGGLMRGLLIGGLFGMLLGHGFGGIGGMMSMLFQFLLIGGLIWLALRMFRRQEPAMAGGPRANRYEAPRQPAPNTFNVPRMGSGAAPSAPVSRDIELNQTDLDRFERMLSAVQDAFSREDHGALRRLTTPEMVSYLSEELADNAQKGVRNEVSDVRLLQADIAEAWNEGADDYATAALRYTSRDTLRDRATGQMTLGSDETASETTELWTFRRTNGGEWKLSAIQEA